MKHFLSLLLLQLVSIFCFSQSLLPAGRTANWKDISTLDIPVLTDTVRINMNDRGGDATGASDNSAILTSVIADLKATGKAGIVFFDAGTYLFNKTIYLTDNIILKGTGSTTTTLRFIMGGTGDLISVNGSLDYSTTTTIIGDGVMNQTKLRVTNPSTFAVGDMVKLLETDTDLMYSSWAVGNVGQIMQIKSIVGDSIEFYSTMRLLYPASRNPYLIKANTVKNVGISCLGVIRADNVTDGNQYSNIVFNITSNCWVNGIRSDSTFFAHVALSNSYHDVISGSYFANSYDYGSDGRAYGIACQYSSSENLIINNIFRRLRHSMLLQAGANGNVFAYNYSRETYWVQGIIPSDASGDIVFHGNYPFSNLFEGNIVQNLELDSSHQKNGPYNLFFRNRAENVGIFMNPKSGDSSAFIGNEVTTTSTKASSYFGLVYGQYTLTGNGNFTYGNNSRGTYKPDNQVATSGLPENSYYLSAQPSFFAGNWPSIGYPNTLNSGTIPAKARYDAGNYTVCSPPSNTVLAIANLVLSGQALGNINNLSWNATATGDATNYKIMMSVDGVHFDSIGHQITSPTIAQTTYRFSYYLDSALQKSILYYKILAYQKGELVATSNVFTLRNTINQSDNLIVTVYPNPTNSLVSAIFYAESDKALFAKIIDQDGKQLFYTKLLTVNGWNKVKFSLTTFPAATYYLSINLNGVEKMYPIVKQ